MASENKLGGLALFFCLTLAIGAAGAAPSEFTRRFLGELVSLEAQRNPDDTLSERSLHRLKVSFAIERAAYAIHEAYVTGAWRRGFTGDWMRWCDEGPQPSRFLGCLELNHRLASVFFERTVQTIGSRGADTRLFELERQAKWNGKQTHFQVGSVLAAAGFHRGRSFVFMSIDDIPHDQWNLTFVHELIHAIDPQLDSAVYYNSREASYLLEWVDDVDGRRQRFELPENRRLLRNWLLVGLHRGLLAEWRAWVATVSLYLLDRAEHTQLFADSPLVERFARAPRGTRKQVLYDYLEAHFPDPREGIYAHPLVMEELARLKADLRAQHGDLPLTGLEGLVEPGF